MLFVKGKKLVVNWEFYKEFYKTIYKKPIVYKKPNIALFGAPRSGTNYLFYLINSNYDVNIGFNGGYGWKHGFANTDKLSHNNCCVVVVVKNIFAWLCSMYDFYRRNSYGERILPKNTKNLMDFIKSDFAFKRLGQFLVYKNVIDYWNHIYRHWLALSLIGRPVFVIKYEDLITDAELALSEFTSTLNIEKKQESFVNSERQLNPTGKLELKSYRKKYYIAKEYMENFNDQLKSFVINELDPEIYRKLGYFS